MAKQSKNNKQKSGFTEVSQLASVPLLPHKQVEDVMPSQSLVTYRRPDVNTLQDYIST